MSSLGPTSAADIEIRLVDLGLCGDLHAAGGGAFGQKGRDGRSGASSLSGGGSTGVALKPETGGERPRKQDNKIKGK